MTARPHAPTSPAAPRRRPTGGGVLRPLTWVVLVLSAVTGSVAPFTTASTPVHLALGLVTTACVAVLVLLHLRDR